LDILHGKLAKASSADSQTVEFFRAKFNYDFVDADGSHGIHNTKYARTLLVSAIENFTATGLVQENTELPLTYSLSQNYPNPFNPTTTIAFDLSESRVVELKLFNMVGQEIRTLLNQHLPAGHHSVTLSAHDLPSGIYVYQIIAGDFMASKKLVLMK
jgi:hypothetical protein